MSTYRECVLYCTVSTIHSLSKPCPLPTPALYGSHHHRLSFPPSSSSSSFLHLSLPSSIVPSLTRCLHRLSHPSSRLLSFSSGTCNLFRPSSSTEFLRRDRFGSSLASLSANSEFRPSPALDRGSPLRFLFPNLGSLAFIVCSRAIAAILPARSFQLLISNQASVVPSCRSLGSSIQPALSVQLSRLPLPSIRRPVARHRFAGI